MSRSCGSAEVIQLRMEQFFLNYPGGPNVITSVPVRGRQSKIQKMSVRVLQREKHLLVLEVEEGSMSQGMQEASRSWKSQQNDSPPGAPEGKEHF